jgi:hypothetical protein
MQIVEHQIIYSPEEKKHWLHNAMSHFLGYSVNNGNNLLTLLATDPPSSRPE